jgi:hypothetical protein
VDLAQLLRNCADGLGRILLLDVGVEGVEVNLDVVCPHIVDQERSVRLGVEEIGLKAQQMYETSLTHDPPRAGFDVPYGNFLKIHYKDVKEMSDDEGDGCETKISPFEIAAQSWQSFDLLSQQTHDAQWMSERDNMERLALPYEPKNMIDLNWKIQLLATVNREKYAPTA